MVHPNPFLGFISPWRRLPVNSKGSWQEPNLTSIICIYAQYEKHVFFFSLLIYAHLYCTLHFFQTIYRGDITTLPAITLWEAHKSYREARPCLKTMEFKNSTWFIFPPNIWGVPKIQKSLTKLTKSYELSQRDMDWNSETWHGFTHLCATLTCRC